MQRRNQGKNKNLQWDETFEAHACAGSAHLLFMPSSIHWGGWSSNFLLAHILTNPIKDVYRVQAQSCSHANDFCLVCQEAKGVCYLRPVSHCLAVPWFTLKSLARSPCFFVVAVGIQPHSPEKRKKKQKWKSSERPVEKYISQIYV